MEPLSQDYVEQTADFFFHLSKTQLDERIAEYKLKQFSIHKVITTDKDDMKSKDVMDIKWRLWLWMVHCFESYGIKIPAISDASIREMIVNNNKQFASNKKDTSENWFVNQLFKEVDQQNMFELIDSKMNHFEAEKILSEKEKLNIYNSLLLFSIFYKRVMLRYQ